MDDQETELPPHVLIFPYYPAHNHVSSMLNLAELLCHAGIHVTFIVNDYVHGRRLSHSNNAQPQLTRHSGFRFETISDGLPENEQRSGDKVIAKPVLRELLRSDRVRAGSDSGRKQISCIIADGVLSFAIDVAEEIGIPVILFRTTSACNFWAFFCGPKLIEAAEFPFQGNNMDVPIKGIPGMDGFLRQRDLPSCYRVSDINNENLQIIVSETLQTTRARGMILNTFEELEGPILAQARSQYPQIYTLGPLHAHVKFRLALQVTSNSLREKEMTCMTWLNVQPLKSVIYINFEKITMMTKDHIMEFWHGLVNSGIGFLWVIRPDSVIGKNWENHLSAEILKGTKERGCIVGWAPQEEVLAHKSVGGFLTHSGWDSTLESIVAGIPMICWPYFGEQHINSRFVGEVWKLGLDMKDTCDRVTIEKMVRDLMDVKREEFQQSSKKMAKLAKKAITEDGSSYYNLECLIRDIRLMV